LPRGKKRGVVFFRGWGPASRVEGASGGQEKDRFMSSKKKVPWSRKVGGKGEKGRAFFASPFPGAKEGKGEEGRSCQGRGKEKPLSTKVEEGGCRGNLPCGGVKVYGWHRKKEEKIRRGAHGPPGGGRGGREKFSGRHEDKGKRDAFVGFSLTPLRLPCPPV